MKPARKGKTLAALEKAAMGWFDFCIEVGATRRSFMPPTQKLFSACSAHRRDQIASKLHAASKKRKGTK